jgi:hypothetical protein
MRMGRSQIPMMLTPQNFFVIGALPRSGTAWLASLLNLHPDIMAFHDGFVSDVPYQERMERAADSHKIVVDVTTGIMPAFDDIPATRLFLERNANQCYESAHNIMNVTHLTWGAVVANASRWTDRFMPDKIRFDRLTSEHVDVRERELSVLEFHLGLQNGSVNREKAAEMRLLNVQVHGLNSKYYEHCKIQLTP